MTGFAVLLRKEWLEQWRTARLPIVVVVFLLAGLSSPLLARFTPEIIEAIGGGLVPIVIPPPTTADAVLQLDKNLAQFGVIVAILLAMGAVATEKDRGTAALLLTKPVGRGGFLVAKLAGIAGTLLLGVVAAMAAGWFYILVLFEPLPVAGFAAAGLLEWLSIVAYASIALLGSTLTRSAIAAGGIAVAAYVVIAILSAVPAVAPWLPTASGGQSILLALGEPADGLVQVVVGTVGVAAGAMVLAWLAFRRQEV